MVVNTHYYNNSNSITAGICVEGTYACTCTCTYFAVLPVTVAILVAVGSGIVDVLQTASVGKRTVNKCSQ